MVRYLSAVCWHNHTYRNITGPCVRVAPDEVHFSDIDSQKVIYNVRESYMKSPWYLRFVTGRIENIFSTSNVDLHRRYRRLLSGAMSESSLATHFDTIRSRADHAVIRMTEEIKTRGATDVSKWWFFMTSDVIGELSFGESFHAVERGQVRI
jgi:cytochrome P450